MTNDGNIDAILAGTEELIEETRSEKKPYVHDVNGMPIVVLPGVFSPRYFKGTAFYAKHVPERVGSQFPFLEIGTGTGAVVCAVKKKYGPATGKLVATDINREAARNALVNGIIYDARGFLDVRIGHVFCPIRYHERFKRIFWNAPFFDEWHGTNDMLARSVFDRDYHNLELFVKGAATHLAEDGVLQIGFSSNLGKQEILERFLEEAGFTAPEMVAESGYSMEKHGRNLKYGLFEARLK